MQKTGPGSSTDGRAGPRSLLDAVSGIWRELPGLFSDRVELLSLELQRAGQALLQIAMLGMALAVLGVTAWLILWSLIITGLTLAGLHWLAVFIGALAAQVLLGLWVVHLVKRLLPLLRLSGTRRHLMFTSSPVPVPTTATPPFAGETPSARANHAAVPTAQNPPTTQARG